MQAKNALDDNDDDDGDGDGDDGDGDDDEGKQDESCGENDQLGIRRAMHTTRAGDSEQKKQEMDE